MRLRLIPASAVALLVCLAALVPAAGAYHWIWEIVLGPTTPAARSTHGMKLNLRPAQGEAGTEFAGRACCFKAGEYVTAWLYRGKHSTRLLGGNASGRGRIEVTKPTIPGITKPARYRLCLQGERSRRVACDGFRVKAPKRAPSDDPAGDPGSPGYKPPTTGPGYQAPTTGPGYVAPTSG